MSKVKVGEHYFLKSIAHVVNEKLYFTKGSKTMLQQVTHGAIESLDKKKKIVQFALIFHLLSDDHPMIKYITMQMLFVQLNVLDNPIKHQFDGSRWEIVDYMFEQVLKQIKTIIIGANFLSLNANEVTIIDDQFWI